MHLLNWARNTDLTPPDYVLCGISQFLEIFGKKSKIGFFCWKCWKMFGKLSHQNTCLKKQFDTKEPSFQRSSSLWGGVLLLHWLQCTMLPLSTKSCLKSSKLRPILNGQFCHAISKNICLNVLGSKQPWEILVFVIFKL